MARIESVVNRIINVNIFRILMVLTLFIMLVPTIHYNYAEYIKYVLAYGILCVILSLFSKKWFVVFQRKENLLLALFCFSYLITIFLNRNNCFSDNIKQLVYMCVFFTLFVFFVPTEERDSVLKNMKQLSIMLLGLSFVFSVIAIVLFLIGYSSTVSIVEGQSYGLSINTTYSVGFVDGRLHGLLNPNATAMISLISICVSLFLLNYISDYVEDKKNSVVRIGLYFNILIQIVCLLLTKSRGEIFGLIAISFLAVLIYFVKGNRGKKCYVSKYILLVILVITILATATLSRLRGSDISTGRLLIWKMGYEIFKWSPWIGMTREGMVRPVYDAIYAYSLTYNDGVIQSGLHNIYLTILVSSGIIGFILIASAILFVLYKSVFVLIKEDQIDYPLFFSLLFVVLFLIVELVESRILYQVNLFNVVFWIYFGYLSYFSNIEYKKLKIGKE